MFLRACGWGLELLMVPGLCAHPCPPQRHRRTQHRPRGFPPHLRPPESQHAPGTQVEKPMTRAPPGSVEGVLVLVLAQVWAGVPWGHAQGITCQAPRPVCVSGSFLRNLGLQPSHSPEQAGPRGREGCVLWQSRRGPACTGGGRAELVLNPGLMTLAVPGAPLARKGGVSGEELLAARLPGCAHIRPWEAREGHPA